MMHIASPAQSLTFSEVDTPLKKINTPIMFPLVNLVELLKYLKKINVKKSCLLEKLKNRIFLNLD